MSFFRASLTAYSRRDGAGILVRAAYRAAERLQETTWEAADRVFDFRRKRDVLETWIAAPDDAPAWALDRQQLWNAVEDREKRKNAALARELLVAFPEEMSPAGRALVARKIAAWLVERYRVAVDAALHDKPRRGDDRFRHPHCHLLFTTREVNHAGFGRKTRELDAFGAGSSRREVETIRATVAELMNAQLATEGCSGRVDHRSARRVQLAASAAARQQMQAVGAPF